MAPSSALYGTFISPIMALLAALSWHLHSPIMAPSSALSWHLHQPYHGTFTSPIMAPSPALSWHLHQPYHGTFISPIMAPFSLVVVKVTTAHASGVGGNTNMGVSAKGHQRIPAVSCIVVSIKVCDIISGCCNARCTVQYACKILSLSSVLALMCSYLEGHL